MITVHAACCVVGGAGVLIRGPSGAGKSSLALFLAAAQDGAFVADDRVICAVEAGRLVARPHAALAGHVEVRGQGILPVASLGVAVQDRAILHLAVDLVDAAPRMPDAPGDADLLGIALPRFVLDAGVRAAGLAPLLIRAALRQKRP
ncbi:MULTISPECIES: HPr kinase/phosphorylase [Methylobacterium]|uniref:HPr kinase/phosphatase C-terminal domain-containing protein n=1 Tax=Methylobacterium longum TaxID=767694 RepID=A0ABT8AS21_9HYPH|nr:MULTISPECIES: HPr kinase/phosphatase C-terminal domain-containing protein [Methylobacterium]MCJ2098672.1 HPr kinase/phosphatase C-terminal domain-containing protein [Methylobacterium sp. E-046]MDN3572236.1 HPr kinase/phosphatase C-terminal domain-containing protein [Methylobacterium longum]GJE09619.1 HPr kinase/phosphorylase [Methylobacterium longum]